MLYPFILTTLAGLSTMIGTLPIFIKIKNKDTLIALACAFASGVMVCVSMLDLIPESIKYLSKNYNGFIVIIFSFMAIFLGILVSMILDKEIDRVNKGSNLYKVGILSMIAIILHNIPEGIVTFIVSNKDIMLGISICIAIALHNIPEGISIAIPIYYSTNSKFKAIIYTLISALSELLGAVLTYLFLGRFITDALLGILFSFIAGIMIQISSFKLLPTGEGYNKKLSYIFFIVGFVFMIISLFINSAIG